VTFCVFVFTVVCVLLRESTVGVLRCVGTVNNCYGYDAGTLFMALGSLSCGLKKSLVHKVCNFYLGSSIAPPTPRCVMV
jgi:hypothetical protein